MVSHRVLQSKCWWINKIDIEKRTKHLNSTPTNNFIHSSSYYYIRIQQRREIETFLHQVFR